MQVFTESTHIVAVRPTGNVYCYEVRTALLLTSFLADSLDQRCNDSCSLGRARWHCDTLPQNKHDAHTCP